MSSRTVTAAGVGVNVYEAGAEHGGTPLVLLHGGGVDGAELSWGHVLESLGRRRHVIAPDLPGYGQTPLSGGPATVEWYADVVRRLFDTLGIPQADVAGLSLGGGTALLLALTHPHRIRRLVLVAPYGLTTRIPNRRLGLFLVAHPRFSAWLSRVSLGRPSLAKASLGRGLVAKREALTPALVAAVVEASRRPDATAAFSAFQASEIGRDGLRTCLMDRLGEIDSPTLVLSGSRDALVPTPDCRNAADAIVHGRLVVFDGCGHWLQRDDPDGFVREVDEFLGEP